MQNINANITQIQADFNSANLLFRLFNISANSETNFTGLRLFNTRTAIRVVISGSTSQTENVTISKTIFENGAPLQIDINTTVNYNNKFEAGIGYRTTSSVSFFIGLYALNKLRFVYNYNQALSNSILTSSHGMFQSSKK